MISVLSRVIIGVALSLVVLALAREAIEPLDARAAANEPIEFVDARKQAAKFIAYYHSIRLTPEQAAIKKQALSTIPAPCCEDYSIATCCCPCNLAKSVWGLTHHVIADEGYDADEVKEVVGEWIGFTNERGYAGDACYNGRCGRPFSQDGCGGMNEDRIS